MHCALKGRRGFTFVEIMIVTTLIGVVSLAIYSSLSQGIKIWQRVNSVVADEDINIFFEKLGRDLRNSFEYNKIKFIGERDRLTFATLVASNSTQPGLNFNAGEVSYFFDKNSQSLMRVQNNISQIYEEQDVAKDTLLSPVGSLNFQYYFYDAQEEKYLWQEEWMEGHLPRAVKIEFEFNPGGSARQFVRIARIPIGK